MVLKSDLTLDKALFDPMNVSEETTRFNEFLKKQTEGQPKWVDVSLSSLFFPSPFLYRSHFKLFAASTTILVELQMRTIHVADELSFH